MSKWSSRTYISKASNSSRLRCRLKNAAARFLTSRASRLDKPVTSGGMKSFEDILVAGAARLGLFTAPPAVPEEEGPGVDPEAEAEDPPEGEEEE